MQISIIHPSRFIFKCIFRISPSVFGIGARIGLMHVHPSPFNTNLAEHVSSAQIDLELHKVANVEKERVKVDFSLSLSQKCEKFFKNCIRCTKHLFLGWHLANCCPIPLNVRASGEEKVKVFLSFQVCDWKCLCKWEKVPVLHCQIGVQLSTVNAFKLVFSDREKGKVFT